MEKLEQLRRNTEKAYQSVLEAMFEVDAIIEERNYYRDLCTEKKDKGIYDKFINATWYNSIDKTPEEGEEVRIRIITNERVIEENAVFKTNEPTGEPAFFWKTGFNKVSKCVLWRRFTKCEQPEDKETNIKVINMKPFDKVLVRNAEYGLWIPALFGMEKDEQYITSAGWQKYCIPYEGNEYLLGTNYNNLKQRNYGQS